MSLARRIAFDVLLRVEQGGAYANVTLDAALRSAVGLEARDRALSTELVYGTLRRALGLDWALAQLSSRPLEELDPKVRTLLRLGAYQLLHLRVPDHAAVGETVALAGPVGARRAAGFVNGVLRSLGRRRDEVRPPPFEVDPALHLLVAEGLPRWLFDVWRQALPLEEVRALAAAVNAPAKVVLRAASPEARDAALSRLAEAGIGAAPTPLSPVGLVLDEGAHPETLPGFEEGALQPQDEGAQLVTLYALLPGAAPLEVHRVLDPCAAPGGKTCHLAQSLAGVQVTATDLHARRAARIGEEARRLHVEGRVDAHAADATKPLPFLAEESQDLVLLDAPCTGLGTVQRHPEIKLRRDAGDPARLAALQARLLDRAAGYVRPGGRLVYAVCTWTPEEGPGQVEAFLARHPGYALDPPAAPPAAPWAQVLDGAGALTTWPHRDGTDGFFAVRLRREA